VLDQQAADQRPEHGGRRERGGDVALVAAALARGDEVADRGHGERHQPAGGDTLDGAHDDQLRQVLGDAARRRGDEEQREGDQQQLAAAVAVAELPPQRSGGRGGDHVGGHEPGDVAEAAEIGGDGRQRRGQDRLVENRGQHREDQRGERQPDGGPGRGWMGGFREHGQ
jgi:hypothetical protein